ncbi:Autophagy-related protein 9 [Dillenia turbinata]|uniref:Autophagy-related protein 9 n=1 Tax=Dillenia turbinata TaxID=194707 RepID=A0AAN8ZHC7_9MAGN
MLRQKGRNAFSIFKWKRHGETSLTAGLLNDVPPEIELSDYRRLPSDGSESPSGFLNGDSLSVEPISDLDLFVERLYSYYCEKGLWCIIIKGIVELLSLGFTICFSVFVLLYIDWNGLLNAKCGMDAVESGIKPCDLVKEAFKAHPLIPLTFGKVFILFYLGTFSVYLVFCFLRFFAQLKDTLTIRNFYNSSLHITDNEIQTMPWPSILEKIVQLQSSQQLCVVKDLSAHDLVMRLMRKENYLIGMINKGVLAFPISKWVPGAGPVVKNGSDGNLYRLILPKTLEWSLNWCIMQSMFDRNFYVRREFVLNPVALKKRLIIVGILMFLLSLLFFMFMLVYLFLKHALEFYNNPSTASSRRWSNLAKCMFREFNEVEHLFRHRINSSVVHASDYLKQFPSPIISVVAKFISFVAGGFAAILIFIALLDESLLEGHLFGRNLFWYAAVFGTITAISRAAISDELLVLDPEGTMSLVVQHSHYMPKRWRGKENTETVRKEFATLFQYTGMMLLEELASIFITPYLLIFVIPQQVEDIMQFIANYTVEVKGVGHVCRFSVFDFQNHGNSNYGSPYSAPRVQRSCQGKLEKSFLSFQSTYPFWKPNDEGKQFLSTIRTFREQKLLGLGPRHAYSPSRPWQRSPNLRSEGDRDYISIDIAQCRPRTSYHPSSLWLIDGDHKNHPYLLEWYYTSQTQPRCGNLRDVPEGSFEATEERPGEVWRPLNYKPNEGRPEENWRGFEERSQSNLEASTSTPFFRESVFQHQDTGPPTFTMRSHWWARHSPYGADGQTSFLEPPDFNRQTSNDHYDYFSDGSLREQELDWKNSRKLSRTICMDDLEPEGEFNLPFDDIYTRSPEINSGTRVFNL